MWETRKDEHEEGHGACSDRPAALGTADSPQAPQGAPEAWRDPDDTLRREPMSRGRGTKGLNDNLAPLVRYLRSQVGRVWDDVYSEICECLRPTSTLQQHVRDHLEDYVAVSTWMQDGEVWGQGRWGRLQALSGPGYGPDFYADPRDGRLRARPFHAWRRPPTEVPDPDVRWDGPDRQLRRIGGLWYALRLKAIPTGATDRASVRDRLLGRTLEGLLRDAEKDDALLRAYGRPGVYAAEKRQLGKRELRNLGKLPMGRKRVERKWRA